MRSDFVNLNLPAQARTLPPARRIARSSPNALTFRGWAFLTAVTLALSGLFMLMPPSLTLLLSAGLLLAVWTAAAWNNLLAAFSALSLVWLTFHARTILPIGLIEGAWQRGGVGLGDLLWLAFTTVWLSRYLAAGHVPLPKRSNWPLALPLPFLSFSVVLPIAGVLVFGYSWSYLAPGLRHIQWFSFALFTYTLVRTYGGTAVLQTFLWTLGLSGVLHALYGMLQIMAFRGTVPTEWIFPDLEYLRRFPSEDGKLILYRATGFTHNPNDLGLWGALMLQWAIALHFAGVQRMRPAQVWGFVLGALTLLGSGSRSALLGSLIGLVLQGIALMTVHPAPIVVRLYRFGRLVGLALATVASAILIAALVFPYLLDRFGNLFEAVQRGAEADVNFMGRRDLWENALKAYEENFPWGSWVAPTYALQGDIDNYYIFLLAQGTPLLLGMFLILLVGYGWTGAQLVKAQASEKRFVGFAALGILGVAVGGAIAVNPLLSAIGIVLFWSTLGWMAGCWSK